MTGSAEAPGYLAASLAHLAIQEFPNESGDIGAMRLEREMAGVEEPHLGLRRLVTEIYASAQDFLDGGQLERAGCIVLDIRLPGRSGLEFQEALARSGAVQPVVLISAYVDVQMAVRAMKAGAIDVLTKPVREQDLLEADSLPELVRMADRLAKAEPSSKL